MASSTLPTEIGVVQMPFGCLPVRVLKERQTPDSLILTLEVDFTDVRECDG